MNDIDIARFLRCEREALYGDEHGQARTLGVHVAALVRQSLVRQLQCEPELDLEDVSVRYDAQTRRAHDIAMQAECMEEAVDEALAAANWSLEAIGDGGTIEAFTEDGCTGGSGLLVTRREIGHAWLDVGRVLDSEDDEYECGLVVHVPRPRPNKVATAVLYVRPARPLMDAWRAFAVHVEAAAYEPSSVLARPGEHCRRCAISDCVVRAAAWNEGRG